MKYIIIGGVAGGASTAARLRRLDECAEIILLEKGEYISYANCGLPYYIGEVIKDRNKLLVQTAQGFRNRFQIDVRVRNEVLKIIPEENQVLIKDLNSGHMYTESYDKLVLSLGAEPIKPPIPGLETPGIFTLRNVQDTDFIKKYIEIKHVKTAVIMGGGFIGLEMAENLFHLGIEITLIELGEQILSPLDYPLAAIAQNYIREKGIKIYLRTEVKEFSSRKGKIHIQLKDEESLETDMVILSIGVFPDTNLAKKAGLKIGEAKGIWVNEYLQTSNQSIYAVGDAIEYPNPISNISGLTYLAGPANKQGRICALNISKGNIRTYEGSLSTAILKVFDMVVAITGVSSKNLLRNKIPHNTSTTHSGSHAGYYPGSQLMTLQITFSPNDGKILGAQCVGFEGVDKRVDIISSILKLGGNIYDLTEFEQAYAPPFSSAKDPVNMAGFVAENILDQIHNVFYWDQIHTIHNEDILIDVRNPEEHRHGNIPGSISIPLDTLRSKLETLSKNKTIYVFCEVGQRGYLAQRILLQNGFNKVYNLSGGYKTWHTAQSEKTLLQAKEVQKEIQIH